MSDCEDCKKCKCGKKKEPPTIEKASMILYAFLYPKERKNLQGCTIDNGKLVVYLSKETEHLRSCCATRR